MYHICKKGVRYPPDKGKGARDKDQSQQGNVVQIKDRSDAIAQAVRLNAIQPDGWAVYDADTCKTVFTVETV